MADTPHDADKSVAPPDAPNKDAEIDYEAEARKMGWRPESEYKGVGKFLDAETFYNNGLTVLPIVKHENAALRQELVRVKANAAEFAKVVERDKQRAIDDLTRQLAEAKAERKEAFAQSDADKFEEAETKVEQVTAKLTEAKSEKTPKVTDNSQFDPEFLAWAETPRGKQYMENARIRSMANGLIYGPDGKITKEFEHLQGKGTQLYEAVMTRVEDIDAAMTRAARGDLERPGPAGGGRGVDGGGGRNAVAKRSYENLTPEFKSMCDSMGKDFGAKDMKVWREQYVNGCTDDAFKG